MGKMIGTKPGGKESKTEMTVAKAKKISKASAGGEKQTGAKKFMSGKRAK